jgi:hypothetical protein
VTFPSFEKSLKHAVLLPEIDTRNCTSVESKAAFNPSQGTTWGSAHAPYGAANSQYFNIDIINYSRREVRKMFKQMP